MTVIGLTGGIGMGKSACADLLRARRIPVLDTDILARQIVEPGQPALAEVVARFGNAVLKPDGHLSRSELARIVFSDTVARQDLEGILHPRIRDLWQRQVREWESEGHDLVVIVIPLLFETGAETEFDAIICLACSTTTQVQRLSSRGWTEKQIQHRLAAQWPTDKKVALSNYVIWTEGSLDVHSEQLELILRSVTGEPSRRAL